MSVPPIVRSNEECDRLLCSKGAPFEIEERVVNDSGLKLRFWAKTPPSFREYLIDCFTKWAATDRVLINQPVPEPAPYHAREDVTFKRIFERSFEIAAILREQGVGVGTKVAIGGMNESGLVETFIAVHLLGGVTVMLNATFTHVPQAHCLGVTQPHLVIVSSELATVLAPIRKELDGKGVGKLLSWNNIDHLPKDVQAQVTSFAKVKPSAQAIADVRAGKGVEGLHPESDAIILFTSGTTSLPKAALSTQRQALHHAFTGKYIIARTIARIGGSLQMIDEMLQPPPEQQTTLFAVPLFHVTGLLTMMLRSIEGGNKVVYIRRWNVPEVINLMKQYKINIVSGVPSIVQAILQSPDMRDHPMEMLSYGGGPPPERMGKDISKRWPAAQAVHAWGMTEINGVGMAVMGPDYINNPETVGFPIPIFDVKITDDNDKTVPPGTLGLLKIRGGGVMKEYYNNPEATAKAVDKDGWFDTGDVAIMDESGSLYIRDRAKDVIIRGGENIASQEVENEVYKDDRIAEAAAVSVPCPIHGERVGVAVSLAPGAKATAQSVMDAVHPRLRHPARPSIVVVHHEPLPRNANGKFLKFEIAKFVRAAWDKQGRKELKATARL